MVASRATADLLHQLLVRYLPWGSMGSFLAALEEIPGNKSFRDTVERVRLLERERAARQKCAERNQNQGE